VRTGDQYLWNFGQRSADFGEEFVLGSHAVAVLTGIVSVVLYLLNDNLARVELLNDRTVMIDPDDGVEQRHGKPPVETI
jgi:hypothetical protein